MNKRLLIGFLTCFLLSGFTNTARADPCPPPSCPDCYTWNGSACVWACGAGNCCGGSCCSNTCCGVNCYNPATQKCCTDSYPYYLCDSNQTCCQGTCCDPNKVCCKPGDINQRGTCCDPTCEICCDGKCCKYWQCCIDGECVDPICDNCQAIWGILIECGHGPYDPNGTSCLTDLCIWNELASASCSYKGPDWPCNKSRCDTMTVFPWEPEITQIVLDSPCPGGTVNWEVWKRIYWGCGYTTCLPVRYRKACETNSCVYNPIEESLDHIGSKRECGTCGYICDD